MIQNPSQYLNETCDMIFDKRLFNNQDGALEQEAKTKAFVKDLVPKIETIFEQVN